jgi:hypothetical protein
MICTYSPSNSAEQAIQAQAESPTKKRHVEDDASADSPGDLDTRTSLPRDPAQRADPGGKVSSWERRSAIPGLNGVTVKVEDLESAKLSLQPEAGTRSGTFDHEGRSRQSTASGLEDEAEVYTETRMLQDPTGRLRR